MADDRWLYKLLGIDQDEEGDEDLREAGIPPALLFMRALMNQGRGGGGMKDTLAKVLSGAGNAATQIGLGARDLGAFGAQRAEQVDEAFASRMRPYGSMLGAIPGLVERGLSQPLFVPQAGVAFNRVMGELAASQGVPPSAPVNQAPIGRMPISPVRPLPPPPGTQTRSSPYLRASRRDAAPRTTRRPLPGKGAAPKRPSRGPLAGGR